MIVITDANIFMHLIDAGLLDSFFKLELEFSTTREVFGEIGEEQQQLSPYCDSGQLLVINSSDEEVELIEEFECAAGLSFPDRTIIYHANAKKWVVLTGEKLMRNECEARELEVHGILWIMDEMIGAGVISPLEMAAKLEELINLPDFRVPKTDCKSRIDAWKDA